MPQPDAARVAADTRALIDPTVFDLRGFCRALSVGSFGFAAWQVVAGIVLARPNDFVAAFLIAGHALWLAVPLRIAKRGEVERAIVAICAGLFVLTLTLITVRRDLPALAFLPILPVVIALPYVRLATIRATAVAAVATSCTVVASQALSPLEPQAGFIGMASRALALVILGSLIIAPLWQFRNRIAVLVDGVRAGRRAAEDSEARYRDLFARVPVGLYRTTADGRILEANDALVRMLDYTNRAELLARRADDLYVEAGDRAASLRPDAIGRAHEYQLRRRDGSPIWVRDRASIAPADDDEPQFEGAIEDVTDQKSAEAQVQRRNVELEALHDTGLELIEGLEVDAVLERIVNRATDLVGASLGFLYLPDGDALVMRVTTESLRPALGRRLSRGRGVAGVAWATQTTFGVPDYLDYAGRSGHFDDLNIRAVVATPLRSGGETLGVLGIARDADGEAFEPEEIRLLERFAQLAALALANARLYQSVQGANSFLERVMEGASDAIMVLDEDGRFAMVNPSTVELTGYSESELIGRPFAMIAVPEAADWADRIAHRTADERGTAVEAEIVRRDGGRALVHVGYTALLEEGHDLGVVVSAHDITDRKKLEQDLAWQAFHDSLTGLANRVLFSNRVEHALAGRGTRRRPVAVLFLDLDGFKTVNDSLGHAIGDDLLVAVATRLRGCLRASDTIARLGGDEFGILLDIRAGLASASATAGRIVTALQKPFQIKDHPVVVSASIGVAIATATTTATELLRNADTAMYRAKASGTGQWMIFEAGMHEAAVARLELELELRRALELGEFELVYQPIVELDGGGLVGVEALVRWAHPVRGQVSPADFIPTAEQTGLIFELGAWVLREACRTAATWPEATGRASSPANGLRDAYIAVNLSPLQLARTGLVELVVDVLAETGLPADRLVLEITESAVMQDPDRVHSVLTELRELGVRIALDDFGTGYSSLSHLRIFPIDILKIDRSFVGGEATVGNLALLGTIIRLGQDLDLTVIAEGVETERQAADLRDRGCRYAQGYLFSRPVPAGRLEARRIADAA